MALLELNNLSISFDGIQALQDVSFSVEQGQVFALVGPNGAGKTTVFNCLSRVCRQDTGKVTFKGHEISRLKPHEVSEIGIARTFQNIELFSEMTTLENILLGQHKHVKSGLLSAFLFSRTARAAEVEARRSAEDVIEFLELEAMRNEKAGALPYGVRKRIELGRALALQPELLLLDEPAAGMNTEETEELAWWISEIRSGLGITVLLVEHDMRLVMDMSDRVCVLDSGQVIAEDHPARIQEHPEVIAAYLGRDYVAD